LLLLLLLPGPHLALHPVAGRAGHEDHRAGEGGGWYCGYAATEPGSRQQEKSCNEAIVPASVACRHCLQCVISCATANIVLR
jgi:ferredoxin